jgi:hypothetical protein
MPNIDVTLSFAASTWRLPDVSMHNMIAEDRKGKG